MVQNTEICLAEPGGSGQNCLKHWIDIPGRAADDLQDLRCGGLLPQRLGEVGGLRLHLIEQPHVFDRDYGLIGEGLDQFDLAFCKWPHHLPRQREDAYGFAVAPEGNAEIGPVAPEALVLEGEIALRLVSEKVHYLNYATGRRRASCGAATADRERMSPCERLELV